MYFFSLFILFLLFGWILATTRFSQKVDDTTGSIAATFSRWNARVRDGWNRLVRPAARRNERSADFRAYALGVGAPLFPDEFKAWLAGLSPDEARRFDHSLAEYGNSLGFKLNDLLDGSLDRDPLMRQVFVEAVVVYSPAYRKARQAKKAAEAGNNGANTASADKPPAEKAPSRRKQPVAENSEAAEAAATD